MQITIIDRSFEFDKNLKQGNLLWSVAPFAKKMNWTSMVSDFLCYSIPDEDITEKYKVSFYKVVVNGWNTDVKPDDIEKGYQTALQIKKMKHKDKNSLIFLHKWNKNMELFHKESLNYLKHIEKEFNIEELQPLFCIPHKGVLSLFHFDNYKPDEYSFVETEMLTTTILNNYELPLFSDEVENISAEYNQSSSENTENIIFKKKLLEFVSPASLTFNKLEIIRSELVPSFLPLAEFLDDFNAKLLTEKFNNSLIEKLNETYINYISSEISKTQNAIDDNIYFNQIKNSTDDPELFTLYLCACDINTLLNLYQNVSEMPKVTVDYAREELINKIDFKSTKLFLYLKTHKL